MFYQDPAVCFAFLNCAVNSSRESHTTHCWANSLHIQPLTSMQRTPTSMSNFPYYCRFLIPVKHALVWSKTWERFQSVCELDKISPYCCAIWISSFRNLAKSIASKKWFKWLLNRKGFPSMSLLLKNRQCSYVVYFCVSNNMTIFYIHIIALSLLFLDFFFICFTYSSTIFHVRF